MRSHSSVVVCRSKARKLYKGFIQALKFERIQRFKESNVENELLGLSGGFMKLWGECQG